MQAIREYAVVRNGQVVLNLPEYFDQSEVEVIVLPTDPTKPRPEETGTVRYDINELVRRMPKDHTPEEVNWGASVGKEVW